MADTQKPSFHLDVSDLERDYKLNQELANKEQAQQEQPLKRFDSLIYNALPMLLKEGCKTLADDTEKEVYLIGALGVISGLLPNVLGYYDSKVYSPNLYVYIAAPFGAGKGSLSLCRHLGASIHQEKLTRYEQDMEQFKIERDKDRDLPPPKRKLLFFPANNSKTGIFQLIGDNDSKGIIFETEGDSLADAVKQDYGNYSDGLRKAFHHEPISFYRRTGNEYVNIELPRLSVILSSTFGQLLKLIPTVENGLYSRFLFYQLESDPKFRNVFDTRKNVYPDFFKAQGEKLKELYFDLEALQTPISISLKKGQELIFVKKFQKWKDEIIEEGIELSGMVNRLGLICFRIAMIFSILRNVESVRNVRCPKNRTLQIDSLVCIDIDFNNALNIIEVLISHSVSIFHQLPVLKSQRNNLDQKGEQKKEAIRLKQEGLSIREIGERIGKSKSTVHDWLKEK